MDSLTGIERKGVLGGTLITIPPNTLYKLTKIYSPDMVFSTYIGHPDLFLSKEETFYQVFQCNSEPKQLFVERDLPYTEAYLPGTPIK